MLLRVVATIALAALSALAGCTVKDVICYEDMPDNRILPLQVQNGLMTQGYCAQLCANKTYALAGLEWGSQCWCGNVLATKPRVKPMSDCNMPCTANKSEQCGSDDRMGVFKVQCSGKPEPAPPTPLPTPMPAPTPETPQLVNPCLNALFSSLRFCNPTLSITDRVEDIMKRMTLAEKISSLGSVTGAIKSVGLPSYNLKI